MSGSDLLSGMLTVMCGMHLLWFRMLRGEVAEVDRDRKPIMLDGLGLVTHADSLLLPGPVPPLVNIT